MIKFNDIPLDFEPRNKIVPHLKDGDRALELAEKHAHGIGMTEFESAFLCGALKKFKPKKIIELGVNAGGSTAILLQCLEDIAQPYELHSIDSVTKCGYGSSEDDVGFVVKYVKENDFFSPSESKHTFGKHIEHYGTVLPFVIDEIGDEVDFVILDTMHVLPGEVLDFLAVLPYLKKDAFIILHDVFHNQIRYDLASSHATGVLFSSVTAEKFINFLPDNVDMIYRYPNIAGFQINHKTKENIADVFLTFALRWCYFPPRYQIRAYDEIYKKNYSSELCEMFENFVKANYINLRIADEILKRNGN